MTSNKPPAPIRLEVCVDDAIGLMAATSGGADRIELCAALALGGVTPSAGLMSLAADCGRPVHVMVRPRPGDFVFTAGDLDGMRRDIDAVRHAGLAGVVLGASAPSGALDLVVLRALADHARGLDLTLHRAFDLTPDPQAALEAAVELGFARILTSGCAPDVVSGLQTLRDCAGRANGRIAIMPGGGVTPANAAAIVAATGAREIHASCSVAVEQPAAVAALGFGAPQRRVTSAKAVAALKAALAAA